MSRHPAAREYLRVSFDRSGRGGSVDEQHDNNERAATDRSVTLGKAAGITCFHGLGFAGPR
jgi:hypothetical protein